MTSADRPARTRPAWLAAPILTVSALSVATGVAQFGVTAVFGDVAAAFGAVTDGTSLGDRLGLPGTTIGTALAVIRLASLASLPLTAAADRIGRRRLLLALATAGLGVTSLASFAPSFWTYVALVALARPALSAVNAIAGVVAAEETAARDRSAAIALVTAAYGVGAGIVAVSRGVLPQTPSFRVITAFALVPLLLLPLLARRLREPTIAQRAAHAQGVPGVVPRRYLRPVVLLALMTGALALATGPGFTYLFVYGEGVLDASPLFLSTLVLGAGPAGLLGLVLGRLGTERLGRRTNGGLALALTGLMVALAYSGTVPALAAGYLGAIASSSAFAPAAGALGAELVPTRLRATVAGWVTVAGVLGSVLGLFSFGALADLTGGFVTVSQGIGVTVALAAGTFALLPETRGTELAELEDDAP